MGQLIAIYHKDFATLVDAEKLRIQTLIKLRKLFRLLGRAGDERNKEAVAVITEVLQTQECEAKASLDAAQKVYSENRQEPLRAGQQVWRPSPGFMAPLTTDEVEKRNRIINQRNKALSARVKKAERAYTRAQKIRNIFNEEIKINNGGL